MTHPIKPPSASRGGTTETRRSRSRGPDHPGAGPATLATAALAAAALAALAACSQRAEPDLRGQLGGFNTDATVGAVEEYGPRKQPDFRGIVRYGTQSYAVARSGETVESLAARVGLPSDEVAEHNALQTWQLLRAGELLSLPRAPLQDGSLGPGNGGTGAESGAIDIVAIAGAAIDGNSATSPGAGNGGISGRDEPIRHRVLAGETAYTIARLYRVPVHVLAEWNGLGPDLSVRVGQHLLIPVPLNPPGSASRPDFASAGIPSIGAPPVGGVSLPGAGTVAPTPPSASLPLPQEDVTAATQPVPPVAPVEIGATTIAANPHRFSMPLEGTLVRDFQPGSSNGMDIAGERAATVKASGDGTVAGITRDTNRVAIVILEHENGLLTIYAGLGEILVAKGDAVNRGDAIARLPDEDGAVLHFEMRENLETPVDPNDYLE